MIRLVIFDLDGTLLDTIDDLAAACDAVLEARHLPRHTPDGYRRMVGNGIRRLVERALPENLRDDETVESAQRQFVEFYTRNIDRCTRPYDGIPELLGRLARKGIKLAVISNKFHEGTRRLVDRFFPDIDFAVVVGQREGIPLKPDPQAEREIMALAGAMPEQTLHVGDSAVDIATAKAAGVRSIGVTWGFRPREELEQAAADYIADDTGLLTDIIDKLTEQ